MRSATTFSNKVPAPVVGDVQKIAGFAIVSCDVFDTAVMRVLARPEDLLLALGLRARALGLVSCGPEAFREYRQQAERVARRQAEAAGHDEVRILEVYEELRAWGVTLDPARLAELEFAVERSACRAVEPVRALLAARDPAQRLVFVSDTMLPGRWLATLLRDCGYGEDCLVLSSADTRHSKHSGRMFAHLLQTMGCNASEIVHVGDNPVSDVARPREHGIAAVHLPWQPPRPEPERLQREHAVIRLLHSHRRSRAAPPDSTADGPALYPYVSGLLIGFTLFVLAEARRRGINRIFFLARDGHLPLAIARRLLGRTGENIDLSYLQVSRQSVVVPSMLDNIPGFAEDVARSVNGRPLDTALDCIGIDAEAMRGLLARCGLDPMQPADPESIRRLFDANQTLIRERLEALRDSALRYLDQSGFLAPGPRLIVDVGWRGSTQKALARLTGIPPADIAGSYLGLLPDALSPGLDPCSAAGYLFAFGDPRPLMETVLEGYVLLELFLSAPHGTVLHYADSGSEVVPVHAVEPEPGGALRRQALIALEAGCLREFDSLDAILDGAWPAAIDPRSAMADLEPLLTRPTARDVALINAIPFIQGFNGAHTVVASNPVPLHEWLLNPRGTLRRIERAPWRSGTIRASLPWPCPAMSFQDLHHRVGRLCRLLGR
jgi:FMN phosphatase YigB (HAD superfamily)